MAKNRRKLMRVREFADLIELVLDTLELCQKKFTDPVSGKGPSCILSLRISPNGQVIGYYLPILHNWGWNEYDHAVYGDGIFSLPFSHMDTWQYLTGAGEQPDFPNLLLLTRGAWKAVVGGIRAGQVFFVKEFAEYEKLGLEAHIAGGYLHRGPDFVKSVMTRAWESDADMPHDTATCAFCVNDVNNPTTHGDFIVFDNRFKPHPWHKVVAPKGELIERFPPNSRTRLLPREVLSGMLGLLPTLWEQRKDQNRRVQCGIHFGALGGQTMAHPHLHARQ